MEDVSFVIRPLKVEDVDKVMVVLRNAAFSNILPGVRCAFRGNTMQLVTASLLLIVFLVSWSFWTIFVCAAILVSVVYIFNVVVAFIYAYGPPLYDMRDVHRNYMSDPKTRFWVVEIILGKDQSNSDIAGCIAIVNKYENKQSVAWLRRLAVKTQYRGYGFAKALVKTAMEFCKEQKYDKIDLITTDVHDAARELYRKMGFECLGLKLYKYYSGLVQIWTYEYTYHINQVP